MSTLSSKSSQEISDLLDEYGIKHGPVVDTTRTLYEKKLREVMVKERKPKPSPDKTYYREEEEEVTYVYRTTPTRSDGSGDRGTYMRTRPEWTERELQQEKSYSSYSKSRPEQRGRGFADEPYMYDTPPSYRNVPYTQSTLVSPVDATKAAKSSRLVPLWVQFLFFLAAAAFLYFVFSNMEATDGAPFKNID